MGAPIGNRNAAGRRGSNTTISARRANNAQKRVAIKRAARLKKSKFVKGTGKFLKAERFVVGMNKHLGIKRSSWSPKWLTK